MDGPSSGWGTLSIAQNRLVCTLGRIQYQKLAGFTYVRWKMGGSSAPLSPLVSTDQHLHWSSPPATMSGKGIVHWIRLGKNPTRSKKIQPRTRPGHVCQCAVAATAINRRDRSANVGGVIGGGQPSFLGDGRWCGRFVGKQGDCVIYSEKIPFSVQDTLTEVCTCTECSVDNAL